MTRLGTVIPKTLVGPLPEGVTAHRINWIEVARKDIADARRSWMLWTLGGLFAVLLLAAPWHPVLVLQERPSELPNVIWIAPVIIVSRWAIPLTALVVGYGAIVGERETGSLRLLLGLPITRCDVVVGKVLGRSVVFGVTLLAGLALVGGEVWYLYGAIPLDGYAIFVTMTLLYGLIFVWIGVGLSSLLRARARAMAASAGVFALVTLVWHVVPAGAFYLADGRFPDNVPEPWDPPAWFVFLGNANPVRGHLAIAGDWMPDGLPVTRESTLSYRHYAIEGPGPVYLQPEFMLVVLALWALVPLLLGAWRFGRSDLA